MTGHGGLDQGKIAPILTALCDMHIHILGICGTFMGGVAQLAVDSGHKVTGCDANVYPPMSDAAERRRYRTDRRAIDTDQLALKPDVFVIGNAISRGNPLAGSDPGSGLPYVSGPQWLAEHVLQGRWVLGVAGTHGKTTTASMLAWILEDAGLNPGLPDRRRAAEFRRFGPAGRHAVLRDRGRRIRHRLLRQAVQVRSLPSAHCVLNNLEFDHADIFADLAAIETQFHHLVRTLPQSG
jgi:UDP-N-acetylmuramate: L-alanyl-gamma-D-glutamyl-meso-diaminopimelate ligase